MLSLTIFAAAASAAAQPAPPSAAPATPHFAAPRHIAGTPGLPAAHRTPTVWRFIEPGVDGGQVWL